ncbi:hypothetical protein [Campylobacter sp. RM9328]|uniref:hypothetical protein n=1 Tax=Campylobacter sp. RM9328 TaxID=1705720 RepID=UPI001B8D071C|nr:hypothetical protein [Campylobacter sp. RM9328]
MIFSSSNFKILHQGIDTLVIGVNCTDENVFNTHFASFVYKISQLKSDAQQVKSFGEKYVLDDLGLNYGDFRVSSKGLGQYFGFFSNDDIFCTISDTKYKSNQLYHLKIQFRSVFLLKHGHVRAFDLVREFLADIFAGCFKISVLRLDLATDVTGIKYTPQDFLKFRSLKRISNYTEQTKRDDDELIKGDETSVNTTDLTQIDINNFMRFSRFEGVSFGKNPHMFRIYDKIKQIQNKNISTLIYTKWELNGFDFKRDMYVFRHEVEFGRYAIKRLIPQNITDEIDYIFKHLPAFWSQGLQICKWYDLSDDEIRRITENQVQTDSIRKIYQRCELDENRLKFWDMIKIWGDDKNNALSMHDLLKTRDIKKAKKALKAFVSAVYSNLGFESNNFFIVFEEVKKDLEREGLDLHEYGLSKLAGNFLRNEKTIKNQSLDITNPLSSLCYFALNDFFIAMEKIRSDDYKRPIVNAYEILKEQFNA